VHSVQSNIGGYGRGRGISTIIIQSTAAYSHHVHLPHSFYGSIIIIIIVSYVVKLSVYSWDDATFEWFMKRHFTTKQ